MLELLADNALLRMLLLALLFAVVAARRIRRRAGYRHSPAHAPPPGRGEPEGREAAPQTMGSLRAERVESAWLKLVNSIEKSGLSLVDTKDEALRQKLVAAGFTAPFAPRVYTLVRLVLGGRPAAARPARSSG